MLGWAHGPAFCQDEPSIQPSHLTPAGVQAHRTSKRSALRFGQSWRGFHLPAFAPHMCFSISSHSLVRLPAWCWQTTSQISKVAGWQAIGPSERGIGQLCIRGRWREEEQHVEG